MKNKIMSSYKILNLFLPLSMIAILSFHSSVMIQTVQMPRLAAFGNT